MSDPPWDAALSPMKPFHPFNDDGEPVGLHRGQVDGVQDAELALTLAATRCGGGREDPDAKASAAAKAAEATGLFGQAQVKAALTAVVDQSGPAKGMWTKPEQRTASGKREPASRGQAERVWVLSSLALVWASRWEAMPRNSGRYVRKRTSNCQDLWISSAITALLPRTPPPCPIPRERQR
ncbi:hypothetical protein ACWCQL_35860 [Streptomyces sp. NPDC002073]